MGKGGGPTRGVARQCRPDLTVSEGHEADQRLATQTPAASVIQDLGQVPEPHGLTARSPGIKGCAPPRRPQAPSET